MQDLGALLHWKQVRRIIAQRLLESKRTIPHMYVSADVQLDGVASLREALKQQGTKVGGWAAGCLAGWLAGWLGGVGG